MADLILIADDDPAIRQFVVANLELEGYETCEAANGEEALSMVYERSPSLLILDVMMPRIDGIEVCSRLRADYRSSHLPIIMVTARTLTADKLAGLTVGADDYIIKPFDPLELILRVQSTLRRAREMRSVSPLTGLPGNISIEGEIARRVDAGLPIAVCYADLDNFKAFNDHYGFLRGDEAIVLTAKIMKAAVAETAPEAFVGHVGGDDFVVVCHPSAAEDVCRATVVRFDETAPGLYEPKDIESGGIEIQNRQGVLVRYPVISISIGVAIGADDGSDSARLLVDIATEMKSYAKEQRGSVWAIDRRRRLDST